MTVQSRESIRRKNIALLLDAASSAALFSKAFGLQYSALLSARNGQKPVTAGMARRLEAALLLPKGWMDQAHTALPDEIHARVAERAVTPGDDRETEGVRRNNILLLVGEKHGAKGQFCRRVEWVPVQFQHLFRRSFGPVKARNLESKLRLPQGWLDQEHAPMDLPEEFEERLRLFQIDEVPPLLPAQAPNGHEAQRISSPIARALIEKLTSLAAANKLPELTAVQMLSSLVELESKQG